MSDIKEMPVEEIKQRIGRCYLASIPLKIKATNFRNILVSSGSAQLLVEYDEMHKTLVGFHDALKGELPLYSSEKSNDLVLGSVVAVVFLVIPWCIGMYKIFA